jgi:hypothetical protein
MTKPFKAEPGARGFQLSNPPIFQAASLLASLELFNAVGMQQLREKSLLLTGYLQLLLQQVEGVSFITPTDPSQRGCQVSHVPLHQARSFCTTRASDSDQVSIFVATGAEAMFHALESRFLFSTAFALRFDVTSPCAGVLCVTCAAQTSSALRLHPSTTRSTRCHCAPTHLCSHSLIL